MREGGVSTVSGSFGEQPQSLRINWTTPQRDHPSLSCAGDGDVAKGHAAASGRDGHVGDLAPPSSPTTDDIRDWCPRPRRSTVSRPAYSPCTSLPIGVIPFGVAAIFGTYVRLGK